MRITPTTGDVFLVPLGDGASAGGQVIAIREREELYIAIMDRRLSSSTCDPKLAIAGDPAFLTLTFDAKLANRDWPIIGNCVNTIERFPHPSFKIKHAGVMQIESRDKQTRRLANLHELSLLHYRSVGSAMIIQDAVRAFFGVGPWVETYDKRLASYAQTTAALLTCHSVQ
jgi:hypothetical protein